MKKLIALVLALIFMMSFAGCNQNNNRDVHVSDVMPNKWGITLEAENVSPKGLTLVCQQLGGEDVSDLMTGAPYVLQKFENSEWVDITAENGVWTTEAWPIQKGGTTRWDVNWASRYGELPAGEYRIGKPVNNFRGTGDYDTETFYADFIIE